MKRHSATKQLKRVFLAAAALAACALAAPPGTPAVVVQTAAELHAAIVLANDGGDPLIELRDGTYTLSGMLWVEAPGVTVRGLSGHRGSVIVQGAGMSGAVTHVFNVAGSGFTVEDMTLRRISQHAVQLQPDVDDVTIRNVRIVDTGEQMIKAAYNPDNLSVTSDRGLVEGCLLEYSAGIGPQYYIGGVDAHNARDWTIRGNTFRGIRSPSVDTAEFAVHFWSDSRNTLVEGNLIVNCDRGIGFGLGSRGHQGGIIRNNMIYHDSSEGFADVGIALESAPDAQVYHNTIYQEHSHPNAIEYRFAETTGVMIANNLSNRPAAARDGASGTVLSNLADAPGSWFVDPPGGDLHLASPQAEVVDQGIDIPECDSDFDGDPRPVDGGYDIGADEYFVPDPAVPDIKVNGSDGPVTVTAADTVRLDVSLDGGGWGGVGADWWLAARVSVGDAELWYSFLPSSGWVPGIEAGRQGVVLSFGMKKVFEGTLRPGRYTFIFAIDMAPDGVPSPPSMFLDRAVLTVTAP